MSNYKILELAASTKTTNAHILATSNFTSKYMTYKNTHAYVATIALLLKEIYLPVCQMGTG